jgi:hypothetical protein
MNRDPNTGIVEYECEADVIRIQYGSDILSIWNGYK